MFLYKTIMNTLWITALVFLPFICLFSEKRRATLGFRLGFRSGFKPKQAGQKRIWIHALSVGEVKSALPFVLALKSRHPELEIIFTASTKTGYDMAGLWLSKQKNFRPDQLGYFPYDLGYCVKKTCRRIQPDAVVIVETDLWPNFLYEMKKKQIPVVLINARLSERSLNRYLYFKRFSAWFFSCLTQVMAQTVPDAERFRSLGIREDKICVAGNIKFDQPGEHMDKTRVDRIRDRLGIQEGSCVIVAGSTHEGEEKILCDVYGKVRKNFPGLMMILAPRDPERCPAVLSCLLSHGISGQMMSTMMSTRMTSGPDVVLVDKMGELSKLYALCDVAFIGGSLVRQGGHNPLEPALFSKPVLFGPDMSDFSLVSKLLMDNGGAKQIDSGQALVKELETLLGNPHIQEQMGQRNFEVLSVHSGAVSRIIEKMERLHLV